MNKVEKIKAEIERRYEYWKEKESNSHSIESESRMSECQYLLLLFDSLQEEPVSNDLEEFAKRESELFGEREYEIDFIDRNALAKGYYWGVKAGAQWQKSKDESSTEDLEEVSKKYSSCIYLEEVLSDDDKEVLKARLMNTFKAGAQWQKERLIDKAVKWLYEHREEVQTEDNGISGWISDELIMGFKKAMKE